MMASWVLEPISWTPDITVLVKSAFSRLALVKSASSSRALVKLADFILAPFIRAPRRVASEKSVA